MFKYLIIVLVRKYRTFWINYRVYKLHHIVPTSGTVINDPKAITIGRGFNHGMRCMLYAQDPERGSRIRLGVNVSFNDDVTINADNGGSIEIGDNVIVGPRTVMRSSNHVYSDSSIPFREQGHSGGTILIGENVWIGAGVVVLPDVTISNNSIVGAGSVVTHDVPEYSVVGGVPARVIKTLQ